MGSLKYTESPKMKPDGVHSTPKYPESAQWGAKIQISESNTANFWAEIIQAGTAWS